jgi:hypothetical protein
MTIANQTIRSLLSRRDLFFLGRDLNVFAHPRVVNGALSKLIVEGVFVRLGVGSYAINRRSVLAGNSIPSQPLEVLGPQTLEKLSVKVGPSRLIDRYNSGQLTQGPGELVVNVG